MKYSLILTCLVCAWFLKSTSSKSEDSAFPIDLHAHAFMEESIQPIIRGSFFEEPRANHWNDRFSNQITSKGIEASGLKIVVITLYSHPLLGDSRERIRNQIRGVKEWLRKNPGWILVNRAVDARKALLDRKRVVLLAIEGAAGILETDQDFEEWIRREKVSIVTLVHFMDDLFGGAALLKGPLALANPLGLVRALFYVRGENDVLLNPKGLTEFGLRYAQRLIQEGVWIDLSHSSEKTAYELASVYETKNLPLLFTHGIQRDHHLAERATSLAFLQKVESSRGIFGILPSAQFFSDHSLLPPECQDTLAHLGEVHRSLGKILNPKAVLMGSDFNGTVPHLKEGCGTSRGHSHGFWKIEHFSTLLSALRESNPDLRISSIDIIEYFLTAWEKIRP